MLRQRQPRPLLQWGLSGQLQWRPHQLGRLGRLGQLGPLGHPCPLSQHHRLALLGQHRPLALSALLLSKPRLLAQLGQYHQSGLLGLLLLKEPLLGQLRQSALSRQ